MLVNTTLQASNRAAWEDQTRPPNQQPAPAARAEPIAATAHPRRDLPNARRVTWPGLGQGMRLTIASALRGASTVGAGRERRRDLIIPRTLSVGHLQELSINTFRRATFEVFEKKAGR